MKTQLRRRQRRKRLTMTSLVDVIFLLLMFFMLTTTFSRFAEIELELGGGSIGAALSEDTLLIKLGADRLILNGAEMDEAALGEALRSAPSGAQLLVSIDPDVSAQRLADLLVLARGHPHLIVTVLGPS